MKQFPTAANYIGEEIEKKKMKKSWVLEERLIDSEKRIDKNEEENGTSFFFFFLLFFYVYSRELVGRIDSPPKNIELAPLAPPSLLYPNSIRTKRSADFSAQFCA